MYLCIVTPLLHLFMIRFLLLCLVIILQAANLHSQEIEQLYQQFQQLGISEAVDYEKYYLYSLITHSTAIEGSTLTEVEAQMLFDEA